MNDPQSVRSLLSELVELSKSSKPSSCQTAGYIVKLLLAAPAAPWVFADHLGLLSAECEKVKFNAAVYFRNLLAEQLEVAEDDLLSAAGQGPMYGAMYVIR